MEGFLFEEKSLLYIEEVRGEEIKMIKEGYFN